MEMTSCKNFIKKEKIVDYTIFDNILNFLDNEISSLLYSIPNEVKDKVEEIRLRCSKPLMLGMMGTDVFVSKKGEITKEICNSYIVNEKNIRNSFQILSNYSIYAIEEDLKKGFLTINGGHRIGVSGKVIYGNDGLETIRDISSLNIRIAKEKIGVSNPIMPDIIKSSNTIYNTLIVSPPQCGKTTLLRDIIRNLSNGIIEYNFRGIKVGLVDERSEIASLYNGQPQNNIGVRTDVLDGCQKYDGMILLIRSMSPHVIATDELGDSKDIKAIHEALKAGVKIIATVHGENLKDIQTKPNLKEIINERVFERIIILDNSNGVGTIKDILEGNEFKSILREKRGGYAFIKDNRKYNNSNFN